MIIRFAKLEDLNSINIIRKEVNELHVNGSPKVFSRVFQKMLKTMLKSTLIQMINFC